MAGRHLCPGGSPRPPPSGGAGSLMQTQIQLSAKEQRRAEKKVQTEFTEMLRLPQQTPPTRLLLMDNSTFTDTITHTHTTYSLCTRFHMLLQSSKDVNRTGRAYLHCVTYTTLHKRLPVCCSTSMPPLCKHTHSFSNLTTSLHPSLFHPKPQSTDL